ncbi:MAG TPA: nuclear transport factor 2 family protein [Caulobacteraceae bacterium]|jgi:hypothetical protein
MSKPAVLTRAWSIEGFRAFWARPDPALIERVGEVCTDAIVGYWPRPIGIVRGAVPYVGVIRALQAACPDLSLTAPDHAVAGDLHFVRWTATGTGPDGARFACHGIDRLRLTPDGRVCENYVCSDGPMFAWAAERLRG